MEKIPTIKEIAKRLKVSPSTVSRALHGHPSIGLVTTMRVNKVASELNYERNQTAVFFKQRKTLTIGVIVPDFSDAFFSSALSGIEDYASKRNYNVFIGQSLENPDKEKRILETMKTHRLDGIIISISKNTTNYEVFEQLKKYNIPVVFFDRIPGMEDIHYSACNLQSGMLQAIDCLIEKGHRSIGLINGPSQLAASKERLDAYKQGLDKYQIAVNADLIVSSDLSSAQNTYAMRRLLSLANKPTAIITFNDYVARDAIKLLKNYNLAPNHDISFVSFANSPIWSFMDNAPMASIEQFPQKQGIKAAEILFKIIDDRISEASLTPVFHHAVFDSSMVSHRGRTNV
ncbi:LacI family transcriptional regulator [Mucilaginibacter rubeus]|uniref:LacI family DNA-binding transcriptional regulator n=1 Tax=Mucilaginibacter rubeus TaxID=2027860 RepID=A0AAE6MH14_9SPHI|nr:MULTISPECIES: LacI family DNA-binding transcriptional regulator [Mucilaginibacter]QEM02737.1 LacI family transcriptional regulator [Mucilaginibacter rubeus]QEM15356.1 LacI family transcriptional regulator [Mucilaginibacter gossypii]QTE41914.1 LacI family DNA-binding transcriptional regulator [Mucilaginibacter rubeus]QTE48517.1 LacI family DNA-binding transcriptional regulator [Mucilaginibacter rubeus]QTE59903.1 LacI family DNA-binding transcriptional regulator [Mucilaginibacter rubeus]